MTDQPLTMAGFVAARLDEQEARAKACAAGPNDFGRTTWINRYGVVVDAGDHDYAIVTDLVLCGGIDPVYAHIASFDPAWALRDVAAKRAILARHKISVDTSERELRPVDEPRCGADHLQWVTIISVDCSVCGWVSADPTMACPTVQDLASADEAHPDFNPAWKPAG